MGFSILENSLTRQPALSQIDRTLAPQDWLTPGPNNYFPTYNLFDAIRKVLFSRFQSVRPLDLESAIHRVDRREAELCLRNRADKGFTVIQAVALAELDGPTEPNCRGQVPLVNRDLAAYAQVRDSVLKHAPGFPAREQFEAVTTLGQTSYGMPAVGDGK